MLTQLRKDWQRFKNGTPGERFEEQHALRQKRRTSPLARVLSVGLGVVIIAIGIFALAAPGPGFLIIGLGAALLARESGFLARQMDELELLLRKVVRWALKIWKNAPTLARIAIVTLAVAGASGGAWLMYKVMIDKS